MYFNLKCPHFRLTLVNSTCPQGWRQYHKFCYKHFDNRKTWAQAQYACSVLGSDLISIHNDQEQDFLIYYYQDRHAIHIWTGLLFATRHVSCSTLMQTID